MLKRSKELKGMAFGIDIGGSSVKFAPVKVGGARASLADQVGTVPIQGRSFGEVERAVRHALASLRQREGDIRTLGISTTGSVTSAGLVRNAGHFTDYRNVDWSAILAREGFSSVRVFNDGVAAMWAEFSARKPEHRSIAHFVVGTGIGGGIAVEGTLVHGHTGTAGVLGHVKVSPESAIPCSCGRRGCVESLAAAPAIIQAWEATSGESADFQTVAHASLAGNLQAENIIMRAGWWLGRGIATVIATIDPGLVTVGGGVLEALDDSKGGNRYVEAAFASVRESVFPRVVAETEIRRGSYGNDAGLIGAAILAHGGVREAR